MSTAQPRVLGGRYELTAPISTGGMGQVWRGYDTVLDRDIAVKLIRPDLCRDDDTQAELISRFRREARVTAKIEHPGVPAVYDAAFDADAEQLYLVMQLVHGHSLSDLIAQRGAAPIEWAAALVAQICAALSYAHAVPVVHRDLKPNNIMITAEGGVRILDFGVAAVLRSDTTQLTDTGTIVGTKPYMSPEQIRNATISPRSDLYALGCLLYEVLSGNRVFEAEDEVALVYEHLERSPPRLRDQRNDVPEELQRLVLDLLAKQPEDRPASASDVHDRLRPFLPDPERASRESPVPEADPTRPYRLPVAPRPRARSIDEPERGGATSGRVSPGQAEIDAAYDRALELIEAQRFGQAAETLENVVAHLPDDAQAWQLRDVHAVACFLGGDVRKALPEFDSLAVAYARAYGSDDERVLECKRQAAYCRLELGDLGEALAELRTVLLGYRHRGQEKDHEVLELRRTIVQLQITSGQLRQAADALPELYADACRVLGREDPIAAELREMRTRLELTAE